MSEIVRRTERRSSADDPASTPRGYRRTEAGILPADWTASSVGAEFTIQLGKMLDAAKNTGTPKPYVGNRAVQWGRIDLDALATVPMTAADLHRFRLRHGDLLVCEGGEIGRAAIWQEPIPECYYQKAIHRLRPTRSYDPFLLLCLLQMWTASGRLANYTTQTSIAHLPKDKFQLVPLPVPSPAEQYTIVTALSNVDGLIGALEKLIAKKRAIKQAAIQQLLTGKTRLPGFQEEWQTKRIKNIVRIPVTDGPHLTPAFLPEGIPFLSVNNLVNNRVDVADLRHVSRDDHNLFSKKCRPQKWDVLLGKAASVGNVAIVDFNWEFNIWSPIALIRIAEPNHPIFAYYGLQTHAVRKQIEYFTNSSSQGNIGMGDIGKLELQLPPPREQAAIVCILSDMDAEIATMEQRRDKTRAIKQGMMQQLLTGRVRLVNREAAP